MQEKLHMNQHPGIDPPPFTTTVVGKLENSLFLRESTCYPRGGGQPGDTGKISVIDDPSNMDNSASKSISSNMKEVLPGKMIIHPVDDASLFSEGQKILCSIDNDRRNSHTMMHTAQHIFSALSEDIWGAETVGNQIGEERSRVDLLFEDKSVFDPDTIIEAVNTTIHSKISVHVHEWGRKKIMSHENMRHTKFMHRIPEVITHLRVVEIEGVDLCPCAGTHVSNTSMIPKVKYAGKKNKGKGRLRISYEFE
ncbi:MAG: hypothetical protein CMB66_05445 [Euryarchaeota archaeon]|nr:hypothetical protein [Euryarchaeota archaeon]|tara:strand:+ start:1044 stop:1799 length:756 start_codon:yes stop_codon:yes gene_type:complete